MVSDLYFYDAQERTFRAHGLERNPWDSGVQYRSAILDMNTFGPESGFEAEFRFTVAEGTNTSSLQAVVERPGLYRVFVNGKPVEPKPDTWWLDKSFGVFDIGTHVGTGENSLTLAARPFTIFTELEPVYILGDVTLKSQQKGFQIFPSDQLRPGPWNEQGLPFYAGKVSYTGEFSLSEAPPGRTVVALGRWSGVVAAVTVNGTEAGWIGIPGYDLDVAPLLKTGANEVIVTVYGSLKNTLGPHHNAPPLGRAWPGQFQKGAPGGYPPGSAYSTIGYGLMEEFEIRVTRRQVK
jgi:hypothetical protein